MKRNFTFLLILALATGCSKSSSGTSDSTNTTTTPVAPVTITTTTPLTPNMSVWQLTGLTANGLPLTLTAQQTVFAMNLYNDYRYSDTDGITGNWSSPASDSIVINQTNLPKLITLRYLVKSKSTSQLHLNYKSGNVQYEMIYDAK